MRIKEKLKKVTKSLAILSLALVITLGSAGAVWAKGYYWIFTGTERIKQGSVVQTPDVYISAGDQQARLHSNTLYESGKVYVARNTKEFFFWSEVAVEGKYFSSSNQYKYYDLGEEKEKKYTYYTVTNFENGLDSGSGVDVKIDEACVIID